MGDVETSMIVGAGSSGVTGMLVRLLQMWRSVYVSMGLDPPSIVSQLIGTEATLSIGYRPKRFIRLLFTLAAASL
jgi:hypothetical protein